MMMLGGSPLLQPNTAPTNNFNQNGNDIEMVELTQHASTTAADGSSSSASESESEDFKKLSDYTKWERLSLLMPIFSVLISIFVMVLMIISHGGIALLVCRAFALYSIIFLIATFGRMLWNVGKIQRSGHFRLAGASHVSKTIKLFIYFMTLATIVGYYNRFSYMRIFWKFDFVLNYTLRELELPVDVFCVTILILYLLFQPYYCIIIAPRIGVTIIEKSLFGTTLFLNAFQKWLLETMLVNSEVCEHMRSHDSRCRAFIHYHTNRGDLTQSQNDMYTDVENGASLTYTCTLELFIGVLALLLYLPAPVQRSALEMMMASGAALIHPNPPSKLKQHFPKWISGVLWGKQKSKEEHEFSEIRTPKTHWFLRTIFYLICAILGFLPLYIIYVIPIISVDDDHNHDHNILLLSARLTLHVGLFFFLTFFNFYVYANCKLQPILEEPDLIILVIASFIIAIKLLARSALQLITYFFFNVPIYPLSAILMNSVTTIFEILSFFIFIHFTQKFFHLGHKPHPESGKRWLHMFPTSFLALYFLFYGIIGFAMYYLLNRLHLPFHSTGHDILDNALSIVHSLYPTTTLYNMTMALCYGHIVEQFHESRLYDFRRQKEDIKGSGEEVKLRLGQR